MAKEKTDKKQSKTPKKPAQKTAKTETDQDGVEKAPKTSTLSLPIR